MICNRRLTAGLYNIIVQIGMDKTFNFFKTKARKENERPRNNSNKSNSSKASSKQSCKAKPPIKQPTILLSKKEKEIREAIDIRYQKSKLRTYVFSRRNEQTHRRSVSSHSSDHEEFRRLKKMAVVDLKDYHRQQELLASDHSNSSSQERKRFNLKFKLRDKGGASNIIKTEGNEGEVRHGVGADIRNPSTKEMKTLTPTKISKKTEQWKFISIDLKDDPSKPKPRKVEVKINSHRSYNLQEKAPKMKPNHSMNKYLDKAGKLKTLNPDKLTKTRF